MDPDAQRGVVRVPADPLDPTIEFLERLGFRLEEIAPADDPSEALMTGHGLCLRLDRAHRGAIELVVPAADALPAGRHVGPGGLSVEVAGPGELEIPPAAPALVHTRYADTPFHEGRAGLLYRDLLPSRLGGRWVVSHIRAARGGPVQDRVHHHRLRLQLIYCLSGDAELVYEGQGAPFTFRAGDLVLQPPGLRHRVLSASAGFEVVEVASPARHPTSIDHEMVLPSADPAPDRSCSGQHFLHAVADRCSPEQVAPGVEARDLGLHAASGGVATARALRFLGAGTVELREANDLHFLFVSEGSCSIQGAARIGLAAYDAVALPPGPFLLTGSPGLRVLEVASSA
ncbi:MAG TPA: cupin domain-containing protein [Myxococcaceae bacterium]|nr:cupin domain-containing protein [Myxococcaceae bacterium]